MTGMITTALMGLFVLTAPVTINPMGGAAFPQATAPAPSYSVAMTGYNAVDEQTDGDPLVTASGAFSNPEIIAARSVDLAGELPFGTVVEITRASTSTATCGYSLVDNMIGLRVIADSMHPRKRNQIDILFDTDSTVRSGGKDMNAANVLGMCKDVHIKIVGYVNVNHLPHTQADLKARIDKQTLALGK